LLATAKLLISDARLTPLGGRNLRKPVHSENNSTAAAV
jgi:hypothetical protein